MCQQHLTYLCLEIAHRKVLQREAVFLLLWHSGDISRLVVKLKSAGYQCIIERVVCL